MLRPLGEVQYGLQIDDLRTGVGHGWERLGKQLQIMLVALHVILFGHISKY